MVNVKKVQAALLKQMQKGGPCGRVAFPDVHYVSATKWCLARLSAKEDVFRDDLYVDLSKPYGKLLKAPFPENDSADPVDELFHYNGELYRKVRRLRDGKLAFFRESAMTFLTKNGHDRFAVTDDDIPIVLVYAPYDGECELLIVSTVKKE